MKNERDDIAKAFHNIYLVTAKAFRWPFRPEVDVEFERLSKEAQELDYALADFHLDEIARLRAEVERLNLCVSRAELEKEDARQHAQEWERERDEALTKVKDTTELKWLRDAAGEVVRERNEAVAQLVALRQGIRPAHLSRQGCTCCDQWWAALQDQLLPAKARALLDRLYELEQREEGFYGRNLAKCQARLQRAEAVIEAVKSWGVCCGLCGSAFSKVQEALAAWEESREQRNDD